MVTLAEAAELLASPFAAEDFSVLGGRGLLVVHVDEGTAFPDPGPAWATALEALPCVTVAALTGPSPNVPMAVLDPFDILVGDPLALPDRWVIPAPAPTTPAHPATHPAVETVAAAVAEIEDIVARRPWASLVGAQVHRATLAQSVAAALRSESMAYSLLQSGPEFGAWLAARRTRSILRAPAPMPAVLTGQNPSGEMTITLNRPHVRNALNTELRDGLVEAVRVAANPGISSLVLRGAGSSFCSGGDLDEFGSFVDPVNAHMVRVTRSPAWWVARVADRLRVEVHGAAVGAGAELAAFAGRVEATEDAYFQLPETALGLIPGSGGTVSIPRRIGKHRSGFMALTGRRVDASTALAWGLIDRIVPAFGP
jgi:hypothetical protein